MEECLKFQLGDGGGGCFSDGVASFLRGGAPWEASFIFKRRCPMGGINFGGRVKKYRKMGGLQCLPPSLWETLLHSDRKNCRVDKYLRTYEKTVL